LRRISLENIIFDFGFETMKRKRTAAMLAVVFACVALAAHGQRWPKRELRAAWIATVANIDWPSKKGLSVHEQQQEFVRLLDTLQNIGMNAVIVQVRPVADAFYPSSYEPWSEFLSGTQGQSSQPWYNPLTFMIQEARKHGMEFHAWFNPYRASMSANMVYAANHPIRRHPEWFVEYGGRYYFDPGNPEAREFVLASIMETVKHYDLDAVHFDDYFYPYRIANLDFPDSCSYEAFGKDSFAIKDDWRRHNVDVFIEQLSQRIKAEKPFLKFGISPFGVWRNIEMDSTGSETHAGQTNYDDLFADVLKWLREGWIDYVAPQIYWNIGFAPADYKVLANWWSRNAYGRHLYIGQAAYRRGGKGWEDPDELLHQVELNQGFAAVGGSMYFSAKVFLHDKDSINALMRRIYPYKALVPVMDWLPEDTPAAPVVFGVKGTPRDGLVLQWKDSVPTTSSYYVVYRFSRDEPVNLDDATRIMAIVPRIPYEVQTWTDRRVRPRASYRYVVTAVSRLHRESEGGVVGVRVRGGTREVR
jgi:uncharacterized lipoprotein YddW (UPF0748 family)